MSKGVKKYLAILLIGLSVGTFLNYISVAYPSFAHRLNILVYDAWLKTLGPGQPHPVPVVIDIDEKSIQKHGQLPWPRSILADLVTMLLMNNVAAIGLDIWLTEPDRSSPVAVDSLLEKNFGLNLDLSRIPPNAQDNDRYFRDTIAGKPVVIGALGTFGPGDALPQDLPNSVGIKEETEPGAPWPRASIASLTGLVAPLPIFSAAAPLGLLNLDLDEDGVVRQLPLLLRGDDQIYPALALQTLMTALGETQLKLHSARGGLDEIQLGEISIPIETDGSFRPVYRGPAHTFPHFSARDIIDGKIQKKDLEGKIAFVSTSAHSQQNLRSTPLDPEIATAEIHATIVDNILTGASIRVPAAGAAIQLGLTYFSALAGSAAFLLCTLPVYAGFAILSLLFYIGGSWLLFQNGFFLSPMGPFLALLLSGAVIIPGRYWLEQREKRRLKQAFNQYVAPEVVAKILTEGEQLLNGEQIDATVLFTDVRNFTSISEKLSPTQLVRLLNCYFTPMTACVTSRNGTLDKFIGDSLMAFWNAPIHIENHPMKAVEAALDMQAALAKLRPQIREEFGIDMRMGIGINAGPVHVGNMGSIELLDYTCIGETVNIASRLEGLCKRYGMEIILSDTVEAACASRLSFLPLDRIRVKGSQHPVKIYTPIASWMDLPAKLAGLWKEALEAYFAGSFGLAARNFEDLRKCPAIATAAALFLGRCEKIAREPVVDWNGVWIYEEK